MKGLALLLLGAVTLAHAHQPLRTLSGKICNCNPSEAAAVCSQKDSDGELVMHENCNQFYKCSDGKAIPFFCPSNLLYNPLAEICDWPDNVECGSRPIIEVDAESSKEVNNPNNNETSNENDNNNDGSCNCNPGEAPGICAVDGSDGVLVAHENCNQFYKCDHGVPVVFRCNGNLLYNPYTEKCDWPENVKCGDRPIIEIDNGTGNGNGDNGSTGTCNCNPGEAPGICAADNSDGVLVAHENCNQFYKCDHGFPVVFSCNGNLLYNPYTEQCDWPENVKCGDRPIVEIDNGTGDGGNGNGDNGSTGTCNCNPGEAPGICAADGSDGILVANENCNQFYKCANGSPVTMKCPTGLVYNPYIECCDWPHNVDCGDKPIVEVDADNDGNNGNGGDGSDNGGNGGGGNGNGENTCNCNPSEAPGICAASGSNGTLVAHENCNQFYKCDHGLPVTMTCPTGLLYNPYIECCDWPNNVDCDEKPNFEEGESEDSSSSSESDSESGSSEEDNDSGNGSNENDCNCNPENAPAICATGNSEGVLIAHEKCNKFYKCSFGSPVALKCPGILLYNPVLEICDWPQDVECGDRVIPEVEEGGDNHGNDNNDSDESDGVSSGPFTDPSEAPAICKAYGSNGILVAHEDCDKFYVCSDGSPVALQCPSNLLYNSIIEQCDWPKNVECTIRTVPEVEEDSGTCLCNSKQAPAICADNDSTGKMIAHENCNQFYVCFNGKPIARSCPASLFYEPHTKACTWSATVNCEGREVTAHLSINKHMQARRGIF